MNPLDDPRLDWQLLRAYDFDDQRLVRHIAAIKSGTVTPRTALVRGNIEPAPTVREASYAGARAEQARRTGETALASGELAVAVPNGGMATRFGGVVKGVVEVFDGLSFIALKCEDIRRAAVHYGRPVPLLLMNSFATHLATEQHLRDHGGFGLAADDLICFAQGISVRLTPEGDLFFDAAGRTSYYAPGHGDFFRAVRRSGVLGKLRERGVKHLMFSNLDNLGATIDPVLIGWHLLSGAELTIEVTERRSRASGEWDAGGAPVMLDGRLCVVEGFRFPPGLQERLPDFQTNNMLFDVSAIDRPIPLEHYLVSKQVQGRPAIQFEAVTCEASGALGADGAPLLKLGLLRVPREGPRGRFFPIKNPGDLQQLRSVLRARLHDGWKLRDGGSS